jgi:pSer/pThr/pTyr-binding forkhead associated (FHA) protein
MSLFAQTPDDPRPNETTNLLPGTNPLRRLRVETPEDTAIIAPQREIVFVIRGMAERVTLAEGAFLTIGRSDLDSGFRPDFDLARYGARKRGVSRKHARLHLVRGCLYVTDLESANGAFLNGERLTPHEPHMLISGDNLMLGRLAIRVQFE